MITDSDHSSHSRSCDPVVVDNTRPLRLPTPSTIGFFSVVEIDSIGFCGGYLVLNEIGRPVEFHCTLPVLPQRAQTILYGDSLKPYLFSEHIGPPLIGKAKTHAPLVLVDQEESLKLGTHLSAHTRADEKTNFQVALIHPSSEQQDEQQKAWKAGNAAMASTIDEWLGDISLDLAEPFERIRSAIEEAHSAKRQSSSG